MDGGAWWAVVHGVARSRTWLSASTFAFHFHALEKDMATHSSVLAWRIPGMAEPGGLVNGVAQSWKRLKPLSSSSSNSSSSSYSYHTSEERVNMSAVSKVPWIFFQRPHLSLCLPWVKWMVRYSYWHSWQCEQRDNSIRFLGSIIVLIFYLGCRTNVI